MDDTIERKGSPETGSTPTLSIGENSFHAGPKKNIFVRAYDSFKPPQDYGFDTTDMSKGEIALNIMARSAPKLSKRHLAIISASSCVGTGLFIGSGSSLKNGGPAALLLGFGIMAIGMICTMSSIGELALRYPTVSPFFELPAKFMDPSWGFAVGWMYAFCWMVTAPLELIAGAELTQFWRGDDNSAARVNPVAWVALFYGFTCILQLTGTRAYGEFEFLVGSIKVTATIGFIIFAIIITCGGGPHGHYIGGTNWAHPVPASTDHFTRGFANGFKGIIVVLVSCSFAYGGTEVSSIAAAETANPVKAIPSAVKQVFWRVLIFFIIGTTLVGLVVPCGMNDLGNSAHGAGSPFTLAIEIAKVRALPSIFNSVILCSVLGVANAAVYAGSRSLVALAVKGAAPPFLCYIDREGRPLGALGAVLTFTLLCFVAASDKYNDVFNWLYAFAALVFLFAWASINICFIIFRFSMKLQGVSKDELLFKSWFGIPGGVIGAGVSIATLGLQFWTFIWPLDRDTPGTSDYTGNGRAVTFFQNDLSIPVIIVMFLGHKLYYRTKFIKVGEIDLYDGVREVDLEKLRIEMEEDARKRAKNPLRRIAHFLC